MDHNSLAEWQIERLVDDAIAYISTQREKYLKKSIPLTLTEKMVLKDFFPRPILDTVRFYKTENEMVDNPFFSKQLNDQGFKFPDINIFSATTFRDLVVWRNDLNPELLFHELVHVTQYQKLGGIGGFADKYMRGLLSSGGYRHIPLEEHAYQLGERYIKNPTQLFSVEAEVDNWIAKGSY